MAYQFHGNWHCQEFYVCETTKETWNVANETFFYKETLQKNFGIESNPDDICQGDLSVTQYAHMGMETIGSLWGL